MSALSSTHSDPEKLQQAKRAKRRLYTTTVSGEVRQMQQKPGPGPKDTHAAGAGQGAQRQHAAPGTGNGRSSFMKSLNKSRALNISEFDSGLDSIVATKRRKQA